MGMTRVNAQATTQAAITANGEAAAPGGTNCIIFVDTNADGALKMVTPTGAVWTAYNTIEGIKFSAVPPVIP